ncbi:hypothetical protein SASPL_157893 [Salvia splendens]|uniref:Mitochondrial chaperone BCS1 n=1 Tax=Salvia splendens TaxID=180675 RepID=A0A8X8VU60_SALSN|nr:hypothetical protein SASPL_157893 [Salvia splendens]
MISITKKTVNHQSDLRFSYESLPPADKIPTAAAFASAILQKSIASDLIPQKIQTYLSSSLAKLSQQLTVVVDEFDGLTSNQMFDAATAYLAAKISRATTRIKSATAVTKTAKNESSRSELRYFELSFNRKHRDYVLDVYLPYILAKANEMKEEAKSVRMHTVDYNGTDYWSSVVLNHPATSETMATEAETKELMEDLDRFVSRKDYCRRVGKDWKQGYLLEVQCNSDLRRLLIGSSNRSILVIEDIDCNVGLQNRETDTAAVQEDKITLSGLLNFIDGLWSSCRDEKIIVFTTNHRDRLDPALLRPGRMDVHLEMSYCTFSGFKILASTYLRIDYHSFFPVIGELLEEVEATPAEVTGELIKSEDADIARYCTTSLSSFP